MLPDDRAFVVDSIVRAAQGQSALTGHRAIEVPGMTTPFLRHLINNLCRDGYDYLEIGTLMGATVSAAAVGNTGAHRAIDNFSYWPTVPEQWRGYIPAGEGADVCLVRGISCEEAWRRHMAWAGVSPDLIVADAATYEPGFTTDVLYYDGDHSMEATRDMLVKYVNACLPGIVLVDDWNHSAVCEGVRQAQLPVVQEWTFPQQWNGFYVGVLG